MIFLYLIHLNSLKFMRDQKYLIPSIVHIYFSDSKLAKFENWLSAHVLNIQFLFYDFKFFLELSFCTIYDRIHN